MSNNNFDLQFIGQVLNTKPGRDTKHCWLDLTIRIPIEKDRLSSAGVTKAIEMYTDRSVVSGGLIVSDDDLFKKEDYGNESENDDDDQGKMELE